MSVSTEALPDDNNQLKEIIYSLKKEISLITQDKEYYFNKYLQLQQITFGKKSEKIKVFPDESEQSRLFNEAEHVAAPTKDDKENKVEVKSHRRRKSGRAPIPDSIPLKPRIHDLPEDQKNCSHCGKTMSYIGDDKSKELYRIPEKIYAVEHIVKKYACNCDGRVLAGLPAVVSAAPKRLLPGSIVSPALLAYIAVSKYLYGIPLFRLSSMFKSQNIDISRATMSNWILTAAQKLKEIVEFFLGEIRKNIVIGIDETTVRNLGEKDRKGKSYMWVIRTLTVNAGQICFYHYRTTRSAEFLSDFLKNYIGKVITDGYTAYNSLLQALGLVHAGCWAHVRRKFVKILITNKDSPEAKIIIELIGKLYALEKLYRENNFTDTELKIFRQKYSKRVVREIHAYIKSWHGSFPEKSPMGDAMSYALSQWRKLVLFLKYPELPLDTNAVEREIRPFVIGRKNWLFIGSTVGAFASSLFYSIILTAKANQHEPWEYLTYLFTKWPYAITESDKRDLMPWNVTPQAVRDFLDADGRN